MSVLDDLAQHYQAGYVDASDGRRLDVINAVDPSEVTFIEELIRSDSSIRRTIEIGCGLGFSARAICCALEGRDAKHIIIDPMQQSLFGNIGLDLLAKAGLNNFEHVNRGSEFHLPELAETSAGEFDLIFIDGLHTFDHVMVDLFYANRLLRVGGYIVADDCSWATVAQAISYFAKYPAYEIHSMVPRAGWRKLARSALASTVAAMPRFASGKLAGRWRYPSMLALKKVADDQRPCDWPANF